MNNPLQDDATGKLILRLTLGILILFHGMSKLLNPGSLDFIRSGLTGLGLPEAFAYAVFIGEIVAPLMIILGLFSRIGGALIVINMIFAFILVHTNEVFSLGNSGGWALELQAFYLFCGLAVVFLGSGRIAIKPD